MRLKSLNSICLFIFISIFIVSCGSFTDTSNQAKVTSHFDGKYFHNQDTSVTNRNFFDFLWWIVSRNSKDWLDLGNTPVSFSYKNRVPKGELAVTFISHSTVLIQMDSINILTDPVWSNDISPVPFIGPSRTMNPGLLFESLPEIDIVLISHNHYDHLNTETLKKLEKQFHPLFLTGLGNKKLLTDEGLTKVQELDWWDSINYKGKFIYFLPSRHFSGRGLNDLNETLWGSFIIKSDCGDVYFAGDTGWESHFEQIKKKFGNIRLSILPLGPNEPRWFMKEMHISSEEAVKAHILLNSKYSLGIHFGTFKQSDDEQFEPVFSLKKSLIKFGVPLEKFFVFYPGETWIFP